MNTNKEFFYEENKEAMETLKKQLKEAGVKDKTIKRLLIEINEHQKKLIEKQIKEAFKNMRKHWLGEDDETTI